MKFFIFEVNQNLQAIPIQNVLHFFNLSEVINGSFVEFNHRTYFVQNPLNIPIEKQKTTVLLANEKVIYLPDTTAKEITNIVNYNKDYDIGILSNQMILIYRSFL